jgi:hypothetical protein
MDTLCHLSAISYIRLEASKNLLGMEVKSTVLCKNKGMFRHINGKEVVILTIHHFKFPVSFSS